MANKTPLWPGGPAVYENVQGNLVEQLENQVGTLTGEVSRLEREKQSLTTENGKLKNNIDEALVMINNLGQLLANEDNTETIRESLGAIYSKIWYDDNAIPGLLWLSGGGD